MIRRLRCIAAWLCALALVGCAPPSAAPEPTAAPTIAPTVVPTPTIMPAVRETFDAGSTRVRVGSIANAQFAIIDGRYTVTVTQTNTLVWSTIDGMFANGNAEAEIFFAPGTPATAAGVLFRVQDSQNFYMASLSSDGFYALDAYENGAWRSIIEWTRWPKIDTRGQANRLRVLMQGTSIGLYLNNMLLTQTDDMAFTSGGFALGVNTYDTANVSIQFDNVRIEPAPLP